MATTLLIMPVERLVFFVSDHTGVTAEIVGRGLLSQFPGERFSSVGLPFLDSPDKVRAAAERVRAAGEVSGARPLVFATLTEPAARALLATSGALVMDLYAHFLGMLEVELGRSAEPVLGQSHGVRDEHAYHARIDAVNFALAADDGVGTDRYARAELILIGVSRSGKTPTALYLAMQRGLFVANDPLTEEDLASVYLPPRLAKHREKLRALTLAPERLAAIRAQRRPGSIYADIATCRRELASAELMFRAERIPVIDATARSVEEIAALLRMET
jgi:regulator of PEP synthase PpsR (kinase-PPPase family)